ncbi:MAG: carbamoyltransferase C-terminal domain-containing protein [Alphaproteobacteria bacterium]
MNDSVYVLGVHDGHNCGATLVRDGAVIASVSEERLTRVKNEVGYPRLAIDEVLRLGGIDARALAAVAYASLFMHARETLQNIDTWYPVGLREQQAAAAKQKDYDRIIFETRKRERIEQVREHIGVDAGHVHFVEHHLAHLAAAYFTAPTVPDGAPVLGLTCDGAGDGLCATVSVCRGTAIERLAQTDRHASLGKIYSRVTYLMGMKPWEHEYKLMGLAPYAEPERAARAAEPLRRLLGLTDDGLSFRCRTELSTNYCYEYLRDAFERVRFDEMAAATQIVTEEMIVAWVRSAIARTGIRHLVCGGGVFMNVKANMLIAGLPEVESLWIMPSASDESLSIGSALHAYHARGTGTERAQSVLANLYLGGTFDRDAEARTIERAVGGGVTVRESNDVDADIVDLLCAGEIVARSRGRMEWGARALGNRSLLASADDWRVVDRLNRSIKQRDFWMPFAPSIRSESAGRYFDDPKDLKPWFMTLAYRATPDGTRDLAAGSHPRDGTIRPQVVTREANPDYHRVISLFERRTGRGGVLNTSFNLHGEPIVHTPEDAVSTFLRSGLQHLALNHFILSKDAA